tara:strand:+ start:28 stop:342 length:315 start_codon:yes stop_codon:yes gene_type:complete
MEEKTMKEKLKKFSLYTFNKATYCWTETETVDQAIKNFNRRLNLDHNGYNHPGMIYQFDPISIITVDKSSDDSEGVSRYQRCEETVLKYNLDDLKKLIIKEEVA